MDRSKFFYYYSAARENSYREGRAALDEPDEGHDPQQVQGGKHRGDSPARQPAHAEVRPLAYAATWLVLHLFGTSVRATVPVAVAIAVAVIIAVALTERSRMRRRLRAAEGEGAQPRS
jgi:hypothetical protein